MKNYVHAMILIDCSYSMGGAELTKAKAAAEKLLKTLSTSGQEGEVTLATFTDQPPMYRGTTPFQDSEKIVLHGLHAAGGTRLYGALKDVCERLYSHRTPVGYKPVYVVHCFTDGISEYVGDTDNGVVKTLFSHPDWTFSLVGPDAYKTKMESDLGLPTGTVHGYTGTHETTQTGFEDYLRAVKTGKTKVEKFYASVKSDLDKKPSIAGYREFKVDKDSRIDEFVLQKTKRPYQKGTAYYELIKEELIQHDKDLVAQNKLTGTLISLSRADIGLADGVNAKVTPGNFGDWRIFAQSQASNRKLPRGSRVLVKQ